MTFLTKHPVLALFLLLLSGFHLHAQTVIFSSNGASYTNTDHVTMDGYGPVNVSNCSSISMSLNYNFSLPFPGSGNMESSDECPFGSGCAGDPDPALAETGGCANCWDFIYAIFKIDGVIVHTELVGVPGNMAQSGTLSWEPVCTNNASQASIEVWTQTWAANESITFNNIQVTCWDGNATLMANPNPVCSSLPFNLSATLANAGSVTSTHWSGREQ